MQFINCICGKNDRLWKFLDYNLTCGSITRRDWRGYVTGALWLSANVRAYMSRKHTWFQAFAICDHQIWYKLDSYPSSLSTQTLNFTIIITDLSPWSQVFHPFLTIRDHISNLLESKRWFSLLGFSDAIVLTVYFIANWKPPYILAIWYERLKILATANQSHTKKHGASPWLRSTFVRRSKITFRRSSST